VVAIPNQTAHSARGDMLPRFGVPSGVASPRPIGKMGLFNRDKQSPLAGGAVSIPVELQAPDEDACLIRRCRHGDMDAYGVLVSRHERRVYAILSRILLNGNDHRRDILPDLEDLSQEVFVQAWRALPKFRGDAKFSTWLYRIATNRALKEWKRLRVQSSRIDDTPIEDHNRNDFSAEALSAQADSPQIALDLRMRDTELKTAIDKLPEKQRTVVLLHYFEDYSCEEIAAMLECSVGTVWSRLHYAVKRLRDSMGWLDGCEKTSR
jgi:RNA polymerase sigma-70 factor (ECF subfamily)